MIITDFIKHNHTIESINLQENYISHKVLKKLAEALRYNSSVVVLDVTNQREDEDSYRQEDDSISKLINDQLALNKDLQEIISLSKKSLKKQKRNVTSSTASASSSVSSACSSSAASSSSSSSSSAASASSSAASVYMKASFEHRDSKDTKEKQETHEDRGLVLLKSFELLRNKLSILEESWKSHTRVLMKIYATWTKVLINFALSHNFIHAYADKYGSSLVGSVFSHINKDFVNHNISTNIQDISTVTKYCLGIIGLLMPIIKLPIAVLPITDKLKQDVLYMLADAFYGMEIPTNNPYVKYIYFSAMACARHLTVNDTQQQLCVNILTKYLEDNDSALSLKNFNEYYDAVFEKNKLKIAELYMGYKAKCLEFGIKPNDSLKFKAEKPAQSQERSHLKDVKSTEEMTEAAYAMFGSAAASFFEMSSPFSLSLSATMLTSFDSFRIPNQSLSTAALASTTNSSAATSTEVEASLSQARQEAENNQGQNKRVLKDREDTDDKREPKRLKLDKTS